MKKSQKAYLPLKRFIAIIGSLVGIVFCLSLFWWWIIPANAIATKGHPIFISKRIGQNGKEFGLFKIRSMDVDADPEMTANDSSAKSSTTKFGRFLRKTSLDETLQLFNVFIGQMTFIGPRPLINTKEDSITINKRKENGSIQLKPGISGYAQLHMRANLDSEKKAEYDYYYFKNISLWLDIKIFVLTIFSIFGSNQGK